MGEALRVLIAEDSEDDAEFILHELERGGYEPFAFRVDTAESMSTALDTREWDIVLSDYVMPKFRGPNALKLLQAKGIDIPFILVSGKIGEETAVAIMKAGAHDYIMKGNLKRLVPAIRRELDEAEVRREKRQLERKLTHLASFPELAPTPIVEMDFTGGITYMNPAALKLFPEMVETGNRHPYLADSKALIQTLRQGEKDYIAREIKIGGSWYGQSIYLVTESQRIRVYGRDITEKTLAEEALKASEAKFRNLVENAPIGIAIIGLDGSPVERNRAAQTMHGYDSKEEFMRVRGSDLYYDPADRKRFVELTAKGPVRNFEVRRKRRDGTTFWVSLSAIPSIGLQGEKQFIVISQDIDERKRAEEEIRLKARLLDSAGDMIYLHDLAGKIIYANDATCKSHGYTRDEVMQMNIRNLLTPERAEMVSPIAQETLEKGEAKFETQHVCKDGALMPVEVYNRLIKLGDGYAIIGVGRDITERKKAENELKASEEKFHNLVENAPVGISITTPDGRAIEQNRAVCKMHGYDSKGEFLKVSIVERYYNPEDRNRLLALLEKGLVSNFEAKLKRKDGSLFWGLLTALPQITAPSEKQFITIIQDITERKRAEEELKHNFDTQSALSSILNLSLKDISLDELTQNALDALLSIPWLSLRSNGCIFLVEDKPDVLIMKAKKGEEAIQCGCAEVPFGKCLCGKAAESQKIIYAESVDERHEIQAAKMMAHGHYCVPVVFGGKTLGVVNVYLKEGHKRDKTDDDFLTSVANTLSVIIMRKRAQLGLVESLSKLRKTVEESVQAMALIGEVRDPYTAGHQRRVAELSVAIAKEMGLTGEQLEGIRVAACIHDIGKIQIPAEILSKPARLTEPEFSLIRAHPQVGYEIIKTIDFPWPVAQITLQHHERINGSGYPAHLTGKEIMPEACIMAVADVVEAMMTHRPYRAGLGVDKALDEITENKGVLYDSDVVDTCVKLFRENKFQFD